MLADLPLNQLRWQHPDGCLIGWTSFFAEPAAGAIVAVYNRHKHGVFAEPARVMFDCDRLVLHWADAITDLAAQPLPGETVLDIDHRQPHARVIDIGKPGSSAPVGQATLQGISTHM